jgi:ferritin-like metal-binding protein YciE
VPTNRNTHKSQSGRPKLGRYELKSQSRSTKAQRGPRASTGRVRAGYRKTNPSKTNPSTANPGTANPSKADPGDPWNDPSMERFFLAEVRDLSDAEAQLASFLPQVADAVEQREVRAVIEELEALSERRLRHLARLRAAHGIDSRGQVCAGMRGLIREAQKSLHGTSVDGDIDRITQLQKLLHYAIASSGSLRSWSSRVGDEDAVVLFERMTREKEWIDRDLMAIAGGGWKSP